MAKAITSKNWQLSAAWNGRMYSDDADVPEIAAPSGLSATPSGTSINLEWTDTNGGAASTIVEHSPNGTTGWTLIATKSPGVTTHSDTSLATGTYYYRVAATGAGLTSSYSASASASITGDGALLFSNGFETNTTGFTSAVTPAGWARGTNAPDSGTYCVRGNFIGNKYDSIANVTGNGRTINLVVSNLRANTPAACVVKWRFRIDPANYAIVAGEPAAVPYIKATYLSDVSSTDATSDAFYVSVSHQNGTFRFLSRNSIWLNGTLSGWPPGAVYFSTTAGGAVNVFDGTYHTFEVRFNYSARTFRMFVDDLQLFGAIYFTDGLFNMGSAFHFDQARIFYASYVDVGSSTDGSGIAGGWQLDNVEVYDGPA